VIDPVSSITITGTLNLNIKKKKVLPVRTIMISHKMFNYRDFRGCVYSFDTNRDYNDIA